MLAIGFALLCFIWGTSWVAIKFSLLGFPPFVGAALRFGSASLMLWGYAHWKGISLALPKKTAVTVAVSGLLVYVFDYGLIYWAEQYLNAGVTAVFFSTFPIFMALFSIFLFRGDPFRISVFAGLGLGFAGVAIIFYDEVAGTRFSSTVALATVAVLAAAISGSISSLIVKRDLSRLHPVTLSLQQMVLGAGALFLFGAAAGELEAVQIGGQAVAAVLYLGLMASAVAFVVYYWLLQKISAVTLSLVVFITPTVAVVVDWLLLGTTLSPPALAGMLVIFAGAALSQAHNYRAFFRKVPGSKRNELEEREPAPCLD